MNVFVYVLHCTPYSSRMSFEVMFTCYLTSRRSGTKHRLQVRSVSNPTHHPKAGIPWRILLQDLHNVNMSIHCLHRLRYG